jgi:formiminotetrahydrofolate cyclodeaminase
MLADRSIHDFLVAVQERTPTPGGGSVAALSGALGASLFAMVLRFSLGKNTPEEARPGLNAAVDLAGRLARELTALVDRDAEAYESAVTAAREARQDKDRADLKQRAEAANEQAARVPLETAMLSLRALRELERLAPTLNKNLSSDVLVAVNALLTAVRGGVLNVRVNLPSVGAAAADELAGAATRALDETEAIACRMLAR